MDKQELEKKHDIHIANETSWNFYRLAYDGGRPFIENALTQHPLESFKNWKSRIEEGICFNYSAAIVDLFNFYLTERAPVRHMGGVEQDKQWKMFEKDADLSGTDLDMFLNNSQKIASVYGSAGVLVNKAGDMKTKAQEISAGVYPYCSMYTLSNIYDWEWKTNPDTHRPELVYLKLREKDKDTFTIWRKDRWEIWRIMNDKEMAQASFVNKGQAILVSAGVNPLDEIPFVWLPNIKNIYTPYIGISDIREISYITASIVRNLSHGEEVIKFAGFPMLRLPMQKEGDEPAGETVGVRAVQEFPPDNPQARPDWMEAAIAEPIEAVLRWIDRKTDETYRIAHLSGVHGQRKSNNEVSSGLALRYEFQQLNSVLIQKNANLLESEENIIRLWCKWQNMEDQFEDVGITRSPHFSIDDLSLSLDNIIKSISEVSSTTFKQKAQKHMTKMVLPDLTDEDYEIIEEEILINAKLELEVEEEDLDSSGVKEDS